MEHHVDRRIMDELEDIRVMMHNIKSLGPSMTKLMILNRIRFVNVGTIAD